MKSVYGAMQPLSGAQIGGSTVMQESQLRATALDAALKLVCNSTSSPEMLLDAAKKIEAYLRGEDNKN